MNKFTRLLLVCLCLGVAAMATSPAFAAKKKGKSTSETPAKVQFDNAWTETRKERKQRHLRECRGQVNAGACAGLTRG